jgi:DNA-directed RNA polymerase subunit omega
MLPSPDYLNNYEHGKFVLANLAAKRAKQLREGAMPLVQVDSPHPLTIALAEIAAGKIKPILGAVEERIEIEGADLTLVTDTTIPGEFGMLLPALDETEISLVTTLVEEEHAAELGAEALDADTLSLSDLVGDEEDEEEVVPTGSEDDTLSLSDIAEQEASDEEPAEE